MPSESAACGCRTPEDCKGPDTPNCEYARAMVEKHRPPVTQRFELRLLLPAHWRVTQADGVAARLIDEFLPSSVGVVREGGDDGRPVTHREVADDD